MIRYRNAWNGTQLPKYQISITVLYGSKCLCCYFNSQSETYLAAEFNGSYSPYRILSLTLYPMN